MWFTYDSWSHLTGPDNQAGHHTPDSRGYSDPSHIGNNLDDTSAALEESQGGISVFVLCERIFQGGECVCRACSPQSRSSELSPQSFLWSHTQVPGMHSPPSHLNSLSEQGLGSIDQGQDNRETHINFFSINSE